MKEKTFILYLIIAFLILVMGGVYFNQPKCPICHNLGADLPIAEPTTKRILINTGTTTPEIKGEVFPLGEWKHFDVKWAEDNAKELAKYPDIKDAYIVLEEKTKRAFEDYGIDNFAQGIESASKMYNQAVPTIATEVLKIKPYEN